MWTCGENRAQLCSTTSLLDPAGPAILTQVFMGTDPTGGMGEGGEKGGGRIAHWKVSQVSPLLTPCHQEWSRGQGGSLAPWGGNHLSLQEPALRWGLAHLPRTGGNAIMGSHTSWAGGLRVALECWLCCHGSRKRLFGVKRHQFLPPRSPAAGPSGSAMPGPHCRKRMSRHHRAGGAQNGRHTASTREQSSLSLPPVPSQQGHCGKCTS